MKLKKLASLALAGALTLGLLPALSSPALAADGDTSYTLTIPSTLMVADKGWNALEGGISAKGTLKSGKKLVVTPTSENSWNLVANKGEETESKVGYNLAKETGTYSAAAKAPTWEFTELTADGTSQTAGIIVEDYSSKPAGTYQDTVTFTAKVEDAKPEYYNKLTKINDNYNDQVDLLKELGRGYKSYNSSLTAAQAWELAKYQAAIDTVTVYVIMSSQRSGYEIHYSVSTDAAATEHTSDLYDICNRSNPVRMYYIAQ